MVDLLWRDGEPDAAIKLEELWNDLASHYTFSLLCAYPMGNFYKESDSALFERVCSTHTVVRPTERSTADDIGARDRRIAMLEQRAAALEMEVAQRKQLEAKLTEALAARRRSEELLRDFVDNATIGLHWVLADGTIEWANDAELTLLGYAREEYVGRNIAEFHADAGKINDILCRLDRNEEIHDYEAPLLAKDGSIRWVAICSNVLFEDGKFVHTRCFTRDITARKRLDEQSSFLLEATVVMSRSLDYRTRLDDLSRAVVPRLPARRAAGSEKGDTKGSSTRIPIPISSGGRRRIASAGLRSPRASRCAARSAAGNRRIAPRRDRKSTRVNSSPR